MNWWLKKRLQSFKYAFSGLRFFIKCTPNSWIHLATAIGVIIMSFLFKLNFYEWLFVILAIISVFVAEAFNTAIEKITDYIIPEKNEHAKIIKDIAAGAVLLCAIGAIIIGIIIFLPKFLNLIF